MNPRLYRLLPGIILLGIFALLSTVLIPAASAQTTTIDDKDKVANPAGIKDKIQQYIDGYIPALSGEDPEARTQAREGLIAGAISRISGQPASAGYLDAYSDLLNKALKPLATNPSMVVRLNAAIVVAKVAQLADNTRLIEVVQILLADKAEGVQLWALRASRYVLFAELRVEKAAKADKLIPAIVSLAKQNASGTITSEAYNAMALEYSKADKYTNIPAAVKTEMVGAVVPQMHAILRLRIAAYAAGTISEPSAEKDAVNFLVNGKVWELQDAKTKTATLQVLLDLITAASNAAKAAPGKNIDLVQTVRDAARALRVPFLKAADTTVFFRALDQVGEGQNLKPWDQLPTITQELMKLDKNVTSTSAPATTPSTPSTAAPTGK